jgi:hypothetical protein
LKSSGLLNSARLVHEMLLKNKIDSHLVEVIDNNCIDREVTRVRPTHVVIEALWVVPEKFQVLQKLHPSVTWIIRCHSEIPFLAGEGISFDWIFKYLEYDNVVMSFNTQRTAQSFKTLYALRNPLLKKKQIDAKIVFLPNYYPLSGTPEPYRLTGKDTIDVGCFGAIRPFKNHVIQAVAAIEYATRKGLDLRFHVNSTRIEGNADNYKKNLIALFKGIDSPQFQLIEHPWMDYEEFSKVVRTMDIGLQLSFTETFNIVSADFVNAGIPVVVSPEISWVASQFQASPTSVEDIIVKMDSAFWYKRWVSRWYDPSRRNLADYSKTSEKIWRWYFQ